MRIIIGLLLTFAMINLAASDAVSLTKTLNDFLAGATVNDHKIHDNFWAEELVYTSSSGTRYGKQELMANVKQSNKVTIELAPVIYSAEAVKLTPLGTNMVLTFTLVATDTKTQQVTQRYLNSGVMVWRNNRWQAVNWQATKMAPGP